MQSVHQAKDILLFCVEQYRFLADNEPDDFVYAAGVRFPEEIMNGLTFTLLYSFKDDSVSLATTKTISVLSFGNETCEIPVDFFPHGLLRSKQRSVSKQEVQKCLMEGRQTWQYSVMKIEYLDLVVIIDTLSRKIITVYRNNEVTLSGKYQLPVF
jgi:hypothetical protein